MKIVIRQREQGCFGQVEGVPQLQAEGDSVPEVYERLRRILELEGLPAKPHRTTPKEIVVDFPVELVPCATCEGNGTYVLFQVPRDCDDCGGLGYCTPFGHRIEL